MAERKSKVYKPKGREDGPWYAEWYDSKGKRHRKSTKTRFREAAELRLQTYQAGPPRKDWEGPGYIDYSKDPPPRPPRLSSLTAFFGTGKPSKPNRAFERYQEQSDAWQQRMDDRYTRTESVGAKAHKRVKTNEPGVYTLEGEPFLYLVTAQVKVPSTGKVRRIKRIIPAQSIRQASKRRDEIIRRVKSGKEERGIFRDVHYIENRMRASVKS